jgi:hypothetical protein
MPGRIEDYAIIGNCESAALVGRDGSIDWLALPRFDSAACFAALLGDSENGRWKIAPKGDARAGHYPRARRSAACAAATALDIPVASSVEFTACERARRLAFPRDVALSLATAFSFLSAMDLSGSTPKALSSFRSSPASRARLTACAVWLGRPSLLFPQAWPRPS